jgi:hypothetical protein
MCFSSVFLMSFFNLKERADFSFKIISRIHSGVFSDQILSMKNYLATFARLWAATLASLRTKRHFHSPNNCRTLYVSVTI